MKPLYERYRPASWDQVVGQDKVVSMLLSLNSRTSFRGRAFWITGLSGTGKSTIAQLIASEVADEFFVTEIVAGKLTVSMLDELDYESHYGASGKGGRAYIVNEAHGLSSKVVERLLDVLEQHAKRNTPNTVWIFTTTVDGQEKFEGMMDSHPLLSRCVEVELKRRDIAQPMAERLKVGAVEQGLDGQEIKAYVKLLYDCKLNMRAAWQKIEAGEMLV